MDQVHILDGVHFVLMSLGKAWFVSWTLWHVNICWAILYSSQFNNYNCQLSRVQKSLFIIIITSKRFINSNRSIWLILGTLTGITTLGQSGPGSNGNEVVTLHFSELQNWSLTTRYSLVSYLGCFFFFFLFLMVERSYSSVGDGVGVF